MRVLCLGLDGADYDLVPSFSRRAGFRRCPALEGGTFGPLRSTIPAFTLRVVVFLTGFNPAGHGIFASRRTQTGAADGSRAPRAVPARRSGGTRSSGNPVGLRQCRSRTLPSRSVASWSLGSGDATAGDRPPWRPKRHSHSPPGPRRAIPLTCTTSRPAATLRAHVEEIADVCFLALELEPDLGLLCVDFMSSDIAGTSCGTGSTPRIRRTAPARPRTSSCRSTRRSMPRAAISSSRRNGSGTSSRRSSSSPITA